MKIEFSAAAAAAEAATWQVHLQVLISLIDTKINLHKPMRKTHTYSHYSEKDICMAKNRKNRRNRKRSAQTLADFILTPHSHTKRERERERERDKARASE